MPLLAESTGGPLVQPSDLTKFPGAPFADEVVVAASQAVRGAAGWHIAPSLTETVTIDGEGGTLLFLPTLYLTDVTEVRYVGGDTPQVLEGWRKSRRMGVLYRAAGWPNGFETIEVDMVHGYESCPQDLWPVVADFAQRRVAQESLGSRSVTFVNDGQTRVDATLSRYTIPARP